MGDLHNLFNPTMLVALIIGLIVSLVLGPVFIPMLRRFKFGQNIREDGPQSHLQKAGTPTMGGVIFIVSIIVTMIALRFHYSSEGMVILYSMIAFGFIGLLDDMLKIIHKNNLGLRAWQKMILLLLFSVALAIYGYMTVGTYMHFPFVNGFTLNLGIIYIPFIIIYYAGVTNAVNLTDGLDGLASTVTIIVLIFFAIVSAKMGKLDVTAFCVGLIGALLGFLKYNRFKAKVFMGDTGSLALGGAIATIALVLRLEWVLIIVGGIYVLETVSVILQVLSFKLRGKRIFKMAPIHHHFEQCGWSEVKVVRIFSLITIILCIIGYVAL